MQTAGPRRSAPAWWSGAIVLCALVGLFWHLDYARFWNPDEGRYAAASLEMARPLPGEASDWLVPHLDTVARLNKPPLVYWLAAAFIRALGPSEVAARLVPALAALCVALVLIAWGNRAFGVPAGLYAAVIWVTMALPVALARVLNTDMLLCACICGAFYAGWRVLQLDSRHGLRWWFAMGAAMGLGVLTKGPVGLVLPLVALAPQLLVTRRANKLRTVQLLTGVALAASFAVLLAAPWFLAVRSRFPDFFREFFLTENLARFSGGHGFHAKTPFWFYLPVVLAGALPWTGFLPAIAAPSARNESESRSRVYCLACAATVILCFSFSGTKLFTYVLPAMPPLALLLGAALARWSTLESRWTTASALCLTVQNLFIAVLLIKVAHSGRIAPPPVFHHALLVPLASLTVLTVGAWWGKGAAVALAPLLCGWAAVILTFGLVNATSTLAPYHEPGQLLVEARRFAPAAPVVCYRAFLPSTIFYSGTPVTFLDFLNTSGLDESEVSASPWFRSTRPGPLTLQVPKSALILTKGTLSPGLTAGLSLWGRNNLFSLYCAAPKPPQLSADFTSQPVKRGGKPS